ncbi:hypothetical protein NLX86_11135 [Streptomyces sp. A3M-1-3]|nr:hypothetical protein [Streptomyces sp. A3M-1-3]MCP3818653.1 hypothetical protein [Streptomyces sp. A3M-1-3]
MPRPPVVRVLGQLKDGGERQEQAAALRRPEQYEIPLFHIADSNADEGP